MRDLSLDNAVRALREVSHDMTGRSLISRSRQWRLEVQARQGTIN
jgi:hypothetical protein